MKFLAYMFSCALVFGTAQAGLNEPCVGSGGAPGVCISTSSCSSDGGTSISGACPRTPDNIRCCTKTSCNAGTAQLLVDQVNVRDANAEIAGNCRWSSDCAGTSVTGQCPGPSDFKCCTSSSSGCGGYDAPTIPAIGACKQVAVDGAKKIVAAFPGRIKTIGCIRRSPDGSACDCSKSDHCCGEATDMMCSDGGGRATMCGQEIAGWVMRNRSTLKLKYVIWGQRIWTTSVDRTEKDWKDWRDMEHRENDGDMTANHWDHVHVSYNN